MLRGHNWSLKQLWQWGQFPQTLISRAGPTLYLISEDSQPQSLSCKLSERLSHLSVWLYINSIRLGYRHSLS